MKGDQHRLVLGHGRRDRLPRRSLDDEDHRRPSDYPFFRSEDLWILAAGDSTGLVGPLLLTLLGPAAALGLVTGLLVRR
ncbi:MAG TPA: hypothetical protein VF515_12265 [Candidatus Binatia bacterium]